MRGTIDDCQEWPDLAEQVAWMERSQEDTRKFVAEQHKLIAEQSKLSAEIANLCAARFVTPIAAVIAALGALTAAAPVVARWLGRG